jgi:hypothetical protein
VAQRLLLVHLTVIVWQKSPTPFFFTFLLHWGRSPTEATAIQWRKKLTTPKSWQVVITSWPCWWEKRHYELKVWPVGDCKVIFFLDWIAVASPQWENDLIHFIGITTKMQRKVNNIFIFSTIKFRIMNTFHIQPILTASCLMCSSGHCVSQ